MKSQQLFTACGAPSVLLHLHSCVSTGLRKADLVTEHDVQQHLHHSHPTFRGMSAHR